MAMAAATGINLCAAGFAPVASKLLWAYKPSWTQSGIPLQHLQFTGSPTLHIIGLTSPRRPLYCSSGANSANATLLNLEADGKASDTDVPVPKVVIDQDSDPNATVVEITFGDRLGALLDTMNALRDLGLNVVKANVYLDSSGKHNTFAITQADTGRKVENPELLEQIRLTIINNLLQYHPESSIQLAMGEAFGIVPPNKKPDVDIATHIHIYEDGPKRSLLSIETADRPGLLVEIVKTLSDINVSVESGEFDTEGLLAKAKFHVSYHGSALIKPMQEKTIIKPNLKVLWETNCNYAYARTCK